MPDVFMNSPEGMFLTNSILPQKGARSSSLFFYDVEDFDRESALWDEFLTAIQEVVARNMEAVKDGETEITPIDPSGHINVFNTTYSALSSRTTTAVQLIIVTYGYKDRMDNLRDRQQAIADELARFVPAVHVRAGMDRIQVVFLGKSEGAWAAA